MRTLSLAGVGFLLSLAALLIFSCATPVDPYGKNKSTLNLVGKSSLLVMTNDNLDDSVGNEVSIGFYSYFSKYFDSVQLKLIVPGSPDTVIKTFTDVKALTNNDISWFPLSFSDSGTKTIYGVAFLNDPAIKNPSDTIKVIIHIKPPNYKPHLKITGRTTIPLGQQCNLTVTATDTDAQKVTISLSRKPSAAEYNQPVFTWAPPNDFVGTDTAIFIAKDNGYPSMSDTAVISITFFDPTKNHAPKWQKDTINEVGRPGIPITVTLSDKCTDFDFDVLTYSLLDGAPDGDSIANASTNPDYSFTPGPADTGVFYPRIIATDPKGASDTMTIALNIHVPGVDILPPVMKLVSPASDSAGVSANALSVKIQCTDVSGVASVKCAMGVDTFPVTNADSIYTATVVGLKIGLNTISFIAVDASIGANNDTFFVHIKYDSTIADNIPPTVRIASPSKDTMVSVDSCIIKIISKDASTVASVQWKIGTILFPATKSPTLDSVWFATVKGLMPGTSTVTVIATDASPAANKDSAILHIKYDNDKTAPTLKLLSPARDSTSIGGNATTVQVICKDPSGVASVTCNMGASKFPAAKSTIADSIWSANITGLAAGFNTLSIVAIDSSSAANKDTIFVHIKYDTTMKNNAGPVIKKISGLATGSRTANPNDTLVYTATDQSGVDTVSWTLNGTASGVLTPDANSQYSIKALLTKSHANKIVIIASDKSPNHNKSSDTTILDYNRPPAISGAHDTTIQELSTVQFTVTATDQESDKVSLKATTLPTGATFDTATGLFKWITASGQSGTFPVVFKANDGLDTTVKSISIVISNMPPPNITKNPTDSSVCLGSPVSFAVTATGTGLTYQWKNAASNLTGAHYKGATTNTLSIDTVKTTDAGTYTCVVTNAAGAIASSTGAKLVIPSYTVKFNSNGGSAVDSQVVSCNATATSPATPTKTGYTFAGWYSDALLTSVFAFTTPITAAITLNAKWTAISYTITYNLSGGTNNASNPATFTIASAAITLADPIYTGYTFGGWFNNIGLTGTAVTSIPTGTSVNQVFWAKWTAALFTITFDKNDAAATGTMAAQSIASGASAPLTSIGFSKSGWNFAGWATTSTGVVAYANGANYTMGTANVTLYAKWTVASFSITFDKNDAAATGTMAAQSIASGASAPLTTNGFSKSGWNFAGWATTSTGAVAYADGASYTMGAANVTLYAKWTVASFSITFDKNDAAATGTMAAQSIASGASVPLTTNGFSKSGWNFAGWATTSTGAVAYANGASYTMGTANVTLYAKWTIASFTVTFDKNDAAATGTMAAQSITSGVSAPLTANAFAKTGWSFTGWATTSTGAVAYANGASYTMGTANVTLYAKWTIASFTVTFDKNDAAATGTMAAQSITSGASAPLTANAFAKTGWSFTGWATTSTGAVAYADQSSYTMGTSYVTLYAKWTVIPPTYHVYYDANGGSNAPSDGNGYLPGASATVLGPGSMTMLGYTYIGWNTLQNGTGTSYSGGGSITMGSADKTLYAQWEVHDYDNNIYHTVTIGTQVWTLENLKTTHFRNGNAISSTGTPTSNYTDWLVDDGSPRYCYYGNNSANWSANWSIYGYLYNWAAASDSRNIAPAGWRVPTQNDWQVLQSYLIANGYNYDGTYTGNKIAKSMASNMYWQVSGTVGTPGYNDPMNPADTNNRSHFMGYPGGYRDGESSRDFQDQYYSGYFWSSTQGIYPSNGYAVNFSTDMEALSSGDENKISGFSIRLIRTY